MNDTITYNEIIELRFLLRQTEEEIQKARRKELRKYKITPENSAVLNIISGLGGSAKPFELARWLSRKQHSVRELLDRMEKAGLIKKVSDSKRKNGVIVKLTDEGKKIYRKTRKLKGPSKIFSSLSEIQRSQLKDLLNVLLDEARTQTGAKGEVILKRPGIADRIPS